MYCSLDLRKGRLYPRHVEATKSTALVKIHLMLQTMLFGPLDQPLLLLLRLRLLKSKRPPRCSLVLILRGHLLHLVRHMDLGLHPLAHMVTLFVGLYRMDFSRMVIRLLRYVAS